MAVLPTAYGRSSGINAILHIASSACTRTSAKMANLWFTQLWRSSTRWVAPILHCLWMCQGVWRPRTHTEAF